MEAQHSEQKIDPNTQETMAELERSQITSHFIVDLSQYVLDPADEGGYGGTIFRVHGEGSGHEYTDYISWSEDGIQAGRHDSNKLWHNKILDLDIPWQDVTKVAFSKEKEGEIFSKVTKDQQTQTLYLSRSDAKKLLELRDLDTTTYKGLFALSKLLRE